MTDLTGFTGTNDFSGARNEARPAVRWMPSRLAVGQPSRTATAADSRSKLSWRDFGFPLDDGAEAQAAAA